VIKFVSDRRQDGSFLRVLRFHPPIKLTQSSPSRLLLFYIYSIQLLICLYFISNLFIQFVISVTSPLISLVLLIKYSQLLFLSFIAIWFMVFNATSIIFQLQVYHGCQFNWWMKPEYPEKTTVLSPVTDKLYHMFYQLHLAWVGFELIRFYL
jgi:hypothetical protein